MKKIWLGLVVVLATVVLVAPFAMGLQVEKQLVAEVEHLNAQQNGVAVSLEQLDRHWFSTDIRARISIEDIDFYVSSRVTHGVLWASAKGDVDPTALPAELGQLFQESPLSYTVKVSLLGNTSMQFSSPSVVLSVPGREVVWKGFEGSAKTLGGGAYAVALTLPGLTVREGSTDVVVGKLVFHTEGMQWDGLTNATQRQKWYSNARFDLEHLLLEDSDKGARLELGLLLEAQSKAQQAGETLDFSYDVTLHDVSATLAGMESWDIPSTGMHWSVEGLKLEPLVQAVNAIQASNEELQAAPMSEQERQQLVQQMMLYHVMQALPEVIKGPASLVFKVPETTTNHGKGELNLEVQLGEFTGDSRLHKRLTADGQAYMDISLLEALAEQTANPNDTWGQINQVMAQTGFIEMDDDKLKTRFHLDPDKLVINGEQVSDEQRRILLGIR